MVVRPFRSVDLDEDALARALLGRLDHGLFLAGGDPGQPGTAYALTMEELEAVLGPAVESGSEAAVETGPCLVG